jgi:hypothetical protein
MVGRLSEDSVGPAMSDGIEEKTAELVISELLAVLSEPGTFCATWIQQGFVADVFLGPSQPESFGPPVMASYSDSAKPAGMAESGDFALKCGTASISSAQEMCKSIPGDFIGTHALRACSSTVSFKTALDGSGRIAASTKPLWTVVLVCDLIETALSAKSGFPLARH